MQRLIVTTAAVARRFLPFIADALEDAFLPPKLLTMRKLHVKQKGIRFDVLEEKVRPSYGAVRSTYLIRGQICSVC
jgi:hypothetical protein